MATIDYKNLPADLKPAVYDAMLAQVSEHMTHLSEKPQLEAVSLGQDDLKIADLFVQAEVAKNGFVAFGTSAIYVDPKKFSASMAKLGAYLATSGYEAVTVSNAMEFFTAGIPDGSAMEEGIKAAVAK